MWHTHGYWRFTLVEMLDVLAQALFNGSASKADAGAISEGEGSRLNPLLRLTRLEYDVGSHCFVNLLALSKLRTDNFQFFL